jgi:DNA polymerase-4
MNSNRRIAHLDMDAFFASVELLAYPELRGQPVVVGGRRVDRPQTGPDGRRQFARLRDYAGRGVITTSTYEARALGVFSGMGLMKAAQLAPEAILLPANFDAYREASRRFKAAVASIAPQIEDRGIDEIYIDLSALPADSLSLARQIKQAVRDATGLNCSIGITPNKLLAKIASDLDKPDGITLLAMDDIPTRIWPLAARKINGIGPKADARLAELGIQSIGQLARTPLELLVRHFGQRYGHWLHRVAHGLDERPVIVDHEPKSISRESTFDRDLHPRQDRAELSEIFTGLCQRVADDLQRKGYLGRTIGIKLRFADFQVVTRDLSLPAPTADARVIRRAAGECLKRIPLEQRIRLLGVRVGGLRPAATDGPASDERQGLLPLFA